MTSWTDEELREAVVSSRTWKQVCDRLSLSTGGANRTRLRRRAQELGIDVDHLGVEQASGRTDRQWTDADLIAAVARARNLRGVFQGLGLRVGGSSWVAMKEHIRRLELDLSHWDESARSVVLHPRGRAPLPTWTDQQMRDAYAQARSVADVMRHLGLDPSRNRGRREIVRRLATLGLDPAALPGRGWALGTSPDRRASRQPLTDILVRESTYLSTSSLKKRLLDEGMLDRICRFCGISEWNGAPLVLHLDHINGDRRDNRLENLRLLCPNCHTQTDTYCGRNVRRGYSS